MIRVQYITGDATQPIGHGARMIMHVVGDDGQWSTGFACALSGRYMAPEDSYRRWATMGSEFALGAVQFVDCGDGLTVANMLSRHGVTRPPSQVALRYDALEECIAKVREYAAERKCSVHAPRIGCGSAGGEWALVSDTIRRELSWRDVPVFIYDL